MKESHYQTEIPAEKRMPQAVMHVIQIVAACLLCAICMSLLRAYSASAADAPLFFPAPQKAVWTAPSEMKKTFKIEADPATPDSTIREYKYFLIKSGFKESDGGAVFNLKRLPVSECEKAVQKPFRKTIFLEYPELQAYSMKASGSNVAISACGEDGFFYALMTFMNI